MENVGLTWYKCDFHLHTMTSSCYQNKDNDTVNDWITEVKIKDKIVLTLFNCL